MNQREKLEAQLELLKLEEAFRAKKLAGKLTNKDRRELRVARQAHRDNVRQPVESGAQPETVNGAADVEEVGS
jgi:hypothetical protein